MPNRRSPEFNVCGVYMALCIPNDRTFVGAARRCSDGISRHKRALRAGTHTNRALQAAWNRHGESRFRWTVIAKCDPERLPEALAAQLAATHATDANRSFNAHAPRRGRGLPEPFPEDSSLLPDRPLSVRARWAAERFGWSDSGDGSPPPEDIYAAEETPAEVKIDAPSRMFEGWSEAERAQFAADIIESRRVIRARKRLMRAEAARQAPG